MYIILGQSIHNGSRFIGAYETELEANTQKRKLEFETRYEELCSRYDWTIVELVDLDTMNSPVYMDNTMGQT